MWRVKEEDGIRWNIFVFLLSSNDETIDHLETLFETGSLNNKIIYDDLHGQIEILGKKLNLFIQAIERNIHQQQVTSNK